MKTTQLTDDSAKDYSTTTTELMDSIQKDCKDIERYSLYAGVLIGVLIVLAAFIIYLKFK